MRPLSAAPAGRSLFVVGVLVLGAVALLCGAIDEGSVVSSLLIGVVLLLCGLALLALERGSLSMRVCVEWFVVAYSLRVGFAVLVHAAATAIDGSPFLFRDEPGFYHWAEPLLKAWHNGTILRQLPSWEQRNYWAWLHIVGLVRFAGDTLGGDTPLNVKLVNCAAGALIIPYVYAIAVTIFDKRVARIAAFLAFLLPDYWYLSATLLRDVFTSFVIVVVFYQVLMLVYGRFRWRRLAIAFFLNFGVLLSLRSYVALLVAAVAIGCVLWDRMRRLPTGRTVSVLVLVLLGGSLVCGSFVLAIPAHSPMNPFRMLQTYRLLSQGIDRYTDKAVQEADEDSLGVTLVKLPFYLRVPISAARVLLVPMPPWGPLQMSANTWMRAALETVGGAGWYVLLPLVTIGIVATARSRQSPTVWIWAPAAAFVLALALNTGLMPRWRLMAMPFLLVMTAYGWTVRACYRQVAGWAALSLVVLLAAYIVAKYLWPTLGPFYVAMVCVVSLGICVANMRKRKTDSGAAANGSNLYPGTAL